MTAGLATVVLICVCVISHDRDVANTAQPKSVDTTIMVETHTKSVDTTIVVEPLRIRQCAAEVEDVAFRYVDLANNDVGRTELNQYRRFVRDNPGFNLTFGELRRVDIRTLPVLCVTYVELFPRRYQRYSHYYR